MPDGNADELEVDRSFHTGCPAEADAFVVAAGTNLQNEPGVITWLQTAFRHFKPIAAWGDGEAVLAAAGIAADAPGVQVGPRATQQLGKTLLAELAGHRSLGPRRCHIQPAKPEGGLTCRTESTSSSPTTNVSKRCSPSSTDTRGVA